MAGGPIGGKGPNKVIEFAVDRKLVSADGVVTDQTVIPTAAALTISAFAPTVTATNNQLVTPTTATLTIATFAPTVTASDHQLVTPGTAALITSAFAPTVTATANQIVTPSTVALSLTTFAPTVAGGSGITITPATAALVTAAFAPSVSTTDHQTVTPAIAMLSLTTFAPTVMATGTPRIEAPPSLGGSRQPGKKIRGPYSDPLVYEAYIARCIAERETPRVDVEIAIIKEALVQEVEQRLEYDYTEVDALIRENQLLQRLLALESANRDLEAIETRQDQIMSQIEDLKE